MGILASVFGSKKNTETIVDGAVGGLDKMFFTKEEKSEANQKLSEWYLKYLASTQPQNLARRLIALVIVGVWAFLVIAGVVVKYFSDSYAEYIFNVLVDVVMNPFLVVIGFYFLTHTVRAYQNGKK